MKRPLQGAMWGIQSKATMGTSGASDTWLKLKYYIFKGDKKRGFALLITARPGGELWLVSP
jgi:hypothetical protein